MRRTLSVRWTIRTVLGVAGLVVLLNIVMINRLAICRRIICEKCVESDVQNVEMRNKYEIERNSISVSAESFSQETRFWNTSYEKKWKAVNSSFKNEIVSTFQHLDTVRDQYRRSFLLAQPIINDHNFTYIHTPTWECRPGHPDTLIVVPSAPGNFERRHRIRQENYGNLSQKSSTILSVLFFIAVPSTKQNRSAIQARIEEEVKTYGDIVQENFTDVYRNIRLKAVSMLRWASTRCAQVRFVIRLDDDILGMDPIKMVMALREKQRIVSDFIIGGRVRLKDVPDRNMAHVKWCLSEREYPPPSFPPYALAGSLGYPLSTVQLLYEATLRVPPVWLDDVYIRGICATQLNIPLFEDRAFSFTHKDTPASNMT